MLLARPDRADRARLDSRVQSKEHAGRLGRGNQPVAPPRRRDALPLAPEGRPARRRRALLLHAPRRGLLLRLVRSQGGSRSFLGRNPSWTLVFSLFPRGGRLPRGLPWAGPVADPRRLADTAGARTGAVSCATGACPSSSSTIPIRPTCCQSSGGCTTTRRMDAAVRRWAGGDRRLEPCPRGRPIDSRRCGSPPTGSLRAPADEEAPRGARPRPRPRPAERGLDEPPRPAARPALGIDRRARGAAAVRGPQRARPARGRRSLLPRGPRRA